MAAANFPTSPSVNDIYTNGSYSWKWNGSTWVPQTGVVWSSISDTPTTLSGYGITDAVTITTYVASDVLTKLLTVDGASSGLDADLLDGQHGSYYQNAGNLNAGTILAARMPALTGDITTSAGNIATTLATVNSNVGSFGSATQVATFTVNGKGLITAASNTTITPAWSSITSKPTSISGYGITDALQQGKHTLPILAGAMVARTTNGAASGLTESSSNKIMYRTLDFDPSTAEYAQFSIPMPKSWNEGTITAQFVWSATSTGNVIWGIQAVAISNDDLLDASFGTAQTVTDGVTATTDLMVTSETAAVTVGGSPAVSDYVVFQIYRDAANGSDTCSSDAKLIAVNLFITYDAGNDA